MTTPDHLTRAIDDVARRMTERDAPALRARVMARLEPRRSPRSMFWTIGGLAAAGIAAFFLVTDRPVPGPEGPGLRVADAAGSQPVPGPEGPGLRVPAAHTATATKTSGVRDLQTPGVRAVQTPGARDLQVPGIPSADQLAWQAAAIPLLNRPDPLPLMDIQPDALEVRPLTMAPLDIPLIGAEDE